MKKRLITTKYYMCSDAMEYDMMKQTEITKKMYNEQTSFLDKKVAECKPYIIDECGTLSDDAPFEYAYEYRRYYYKDEHTSTIRHCYSVGCYTIYFDVVKCDEGYCFK